MDEWKIRYEDDKGFHVTDYMDEASARKFFNKKKDEKILKTLWCELCFSEEENDEIIVKDSFERKTTVVMGQKILI